MKHVVVRVQRSCRVTALKDVITAVLFLCLVTSSAIASAVDGPGRNQKVIFFHSPFWLSDGGQWLLSIQGRIFEPPETSTHTRILIDAFAPAVPARRSDKLYRERAGYFLSDSARNTTIQVTVGGQTYPLPRSDRAGYFSGLLMLSSIEGNSPASAGAISFESVPTPENAEVFRGSASLVPEAGVTIVTDIDDTIKITHVNDRRKMKESTFLKPFEAVPGMSKLYNSWKDSLGPDTRFHAVSAGPWQFNEALRLFTEASGFPAFTWDMRSIDIPDISTLKMELSGEEERLARTFDHKLQAIRKLTERFKKRHFVLVGDSGERDPEVYAQVLSEFAGQVDAVFIRNVHNKAQITEQACRYRKLFPTTAARAKLYVFVEPEELPSLPMPTQAVVPSDSTVCPK